MWTLAFITDAGLVGSETTIGGFHGFKEKAVPEFVEIRPTMHPSRLGLHQDPVSLGRGDVGDHVVPGPHRHPQWPIRPPSGREGVMNRSELPATTRLRATTI